MKIKIGSFYKHRDARDPTVVKIVHFTTSDSGMYYWHAVTVMGNNIAPQINISKMDEERFLTYWEEFNRPLLELVT